MLSTDRDGARYFDFGDNEGSFRKHNERMKKFRLAHLDWQATIPEEVRTVDWLFFLSVPRVTPDRFSAN